MKKNSLVILLVAGWLLLGAAHAASEFTSFIHTATAANSASNWTDLDHPLLNGNTNAIVIVTQNWNPWNGSGVYNDHPVGVWWHDAVSKWSISNQDLFAVPEGADFNVFVAVGEANAFFHEVTDANTTTTFTIIDHASLNADPNALVFVTQNHSPLGVHSGVNNEHPIGVSWDIPSQKWGIFNQDAVNLPIGVYFNVLSVQPGDKAFTHTASAPIFNITNVDDPGLNGDPGALAMVTQNFSPGGVQTTVANPNYIGVFFDSSPQRWAIFNQSIATMPTDAAFNVYLPALLMRDGFETGDLGRWSSFAP